MQDPFGKAIFDYQNNGRAGEIVIDTNYTADERLEVAYLFRDYDKMPVLETEALKRCYGEILDIGAAAGCHSLWLQEKGHKVTALEISELACATMKKRGIHQVVCQDIYQFKDHLFDTILLLMNGAGIGQTLAGLKNLLGHLKTMLTPQGQILIDSSDIKYLFEEEDGSYWIDLMNESYYGEMTYEVKYADQSGSYPWLFIDFESLLSIASQLDLSCSLVQEGPHHDYLAKLSLT